MTILHLSYQDYAQQLRFSSTQWSAVADPAVALVIVDFADAPDPLQSPSNFQLPPCPVLGVNLPRLDRLPVDSLQVVDVLAENAEDATLISSRVLQSPIAASILVGLLRQTLVLDVEQALRAESLAYSTLQHGAEFKRFLAHHKNARTKHEAVERLLDPAVLVERCGTELFVQLNRPAKRNAYSAEMRDLLCDALLLAQLDESIERIALSGVGPAFCAGGDLREFGDARDAAVAHVARTTLSAGALMHALADRLSVEVQGGCVGAGIELPSFAGEISAAQDSFFLLPEVSMGLVPGAGGTVSLPRRIGRQRTAWLALAGEPIDAPTALQWGLVDRLRRS